MGALSSGVEKLLKLGVKGEPKIFRLKREHKVLLNQVMGNSTLVDTLSGHELDALGPKAIEDSLALLKKSQELFKERKVNSLGVATNAYSVHEFNATIVGSEASRAANAARGGGGEAYNAAPHPNALNAQELINLIHGKGRYQGADPDSELYNATHEGRRRITPRLIKRMLQDARHKLKKPLYVVRSENAFSSGGGTDALHSATIIDPLDVEDYLKHYTDGPDKPRIYRLEPGSSVYGTEGYGDSSREVLVSRETLASAKSATTVDYHKALKTGTALFGAAAVAATSNPDNADASAASKAVATIRSITAEPVKRHIKKGLAEGKISPTMGLYTPRPSKAVRSFIDIAPNNTNPDAYEEVSYGLPDYLLQPHLRGVKDHMDQSIGTHARREWRPEALRVIEVQSDAVTLTLKKAHREKKANDPAVMRPADLYQFLPTPTVYVPFDGLSYNLWLTAKRAKLPVRVAIDGLTVAQVEKRGPIIDAAIRQTDGYKKLLDFAPATAFTPKGHNNTLKWAHDTINRQFVDAANKGQDTLDFLIRQPQVDKSRTKGVQKWYENEYTAIIKKQAKAIGATIEKVDPTRNFKSRSLEQKALAGYQKTGDPTNLVNLLRKSGSETIFAQDFKQAYSAKTGIHHDDIDMWNDLGKIVKTVANDLDPRDYRSVTNYMRVKLATGTTGAITAFSIPALAQDSTDSADPQVDPKDPVERLNTIRQLMQDGTSTSDIQKSLVSNLGEQEGNSMLLRALQPKIDKLKAQGVSDEDINKSLQAHGLQLPAQPSPEAAGGQPESHPSPLLDSAGQPISTPDELVQQVPKATTASLLGSGPGFGKAEGLVKYLSDPHKDLVRPDGSSLSEDIARMENVTRKYSTMGKELLGTFSASMAADAAKEKQSANEVIKAALLAKGWEVDSLGEYGEVLVKNKQTGQLEAYDASMMDALLAQAYELGGDVVGASIGTAIGTPLGPPGMAMGAILGAGIASGISSGADIVRNAMLMNYQVDMADVLAKMNDVGVADATLGAFGTTALSVLRGAKQGTGWLVKKTYDLIVKGNPEGAYTTVLTNTNTNEKQARELVNRWATATGNEGIGNGALSLEDKLLITRVLGDTSPELTSLVPRAAIMAKAGSAKLRATLDARAKDILRAAQDSTSDNIGSSVIAQLDGYVAKVNAFFGETKKAGIESMKDSDYVFNFDTTALIPAMQHAAKGITNPSNKKEFYNYVELMRDAGGKPVGSVSQIATNKQATVAARTEVSAARAKATALRAERTSVRAKMTAAKKRAKLLKTKKAQDRATIEAEGHAGTIAKLDKQILKAADAVQAKAVNVTSSIESTAKSQQPQSLTEAPRSFENLLQLKEKLNELSSDSKFKKVVDFAQMRAAKDSVDAEIVRAAKKHMPNGDAWTIHWKAANAEYHKMKELESNTLFKALTSPQASQASIVKAFAGALGHEGPKTFMQVMGKLPRSVRPKVEGAVFQHFAQKATIGDASGAQATNFVQLAEDLNKLAFTQPEVRDLKRGVNQMAEVFRNDAHLLNATNNMPLPAFQNSLGVDPVAKAKIAVSGVVYNSIRARLPGSTNSGRAALALQLSKFLDNPLSNQGIKALKQQLPNDPELDTALHQLAVEFTKFGRKEHYGKVPIYRVHKVGQAGKASDTMIGKGVLHYTDKAKAKRIAKQTGAKVQEVFKVHKTIATPEVVARIIGHTPSAEDFKNPEVLSILSQTYEGLAVGDKVVLFK